MAAAAVIRDVYGFCHYGLTETEEASSRKSGTAMQSQAKVWSGTASTAFPNIKLTTFKDLVRKGVPLESRPRVWFAMGSGASLRELASNSYENICSGDIPGDAQISIEQDIANTFRQHQLFHSKAGIKALRRVLTAFAHYNQGSYSKGTAHIAGLLLIIMGVEQEEEAFWTLISLLHFRMYSYSAGQASLGVKVEQKVLDRLVQKKLPKVYQHFKTKLECEPSSVASAWFNTLFAGVLPAPTTARVWDALLLEGSKVMLRVALAIFSRYENTICNSSYPSQLKKVLEARMSRVFDADALMSVAFKGVGSMPNSSIQLLRQRALQDIHEQQLEHQRRLAALLGKAQLL